MHLLAAWIGLVTGLSLVGPPMDPTTQIVTGLGMLVCYGVACRFFAAQAGRAPRPWAIAGLAVGVLAVAVLLVLGPAASREPD